MAATNIDRDRVQALAFYGALVLLGYLVYQLFQPFLVPLGWAGVLVVVCHPWHDKLASRWGPTRAAVLSTLIVAVAIVGPGLLLTAAFAREAAQALAEIRSQLEAGRLVQVQGAANWVQERIMGREPVNLSVLAGQVGARFGGVALAQAGILVRNVAVFLFSLGVTLFAVFFLFRDGRLIMQGVRRAMPFDARTSARIIGETSALISASVTASLVVAAAQGALGGISFAALGLDAPVFWGVVMGFFSLLPMGGAWVVWLPAAVWLMTTGHVARGIVLLSLGAGIVSGIDNFLRPALLSGRARLNGLLVFIGLIGGVTAFGLLGLVLGPVVIAVAVGLFEVYTEPR